jgi:hypothetical protein
LDGRGKVILGQKRRGEHWDLISENRWNGRARVKFDGDEGAATEMDACHLQ